MWAWAAVVTGRESAQQARNLTRSHAAGLNLRHLRARLPRVAPARALMPLREMIFPVLEMDVLSVAMVLLMEILTQDYVNANPALSEL